MLLLPLLSHLVNGKYHKHDFPPMIRASTPHVSSTSGLNCKLRAAEAKLQSFSVYPNIFFVE
jgi:hypothetical protein